jgi:ubiquinone/menaquinone biosynthesis C-methylase UbiE
MDQKQADDVLRAWRESAPYWQKHHDTIRVMFEPITRAIIEDAQIASGQSVLDVAGGTGEPSLTIAEVVGPAGRVTYTDAVAEMVAAAEQEARRRGLSNIEFHQCPADSLPFKVNSFEATVCRLGVMLFPDPLAALREMLRVTKPGGVLSLAVWHGPESNPFFRLPLEVLARYLDSPPADPNAPGAFRFAQPGALARWLEQAGATEIGERLLKFHIQAPVSLEAFWPMRAETSDTLRVKLARLSAEQLQRVAQEVQQIVREFFPNDQMSFPAQAIVVTGRKSRQLDRDSRGDYYPPS